LGRRGRVKDLKELIRRREEEEDEEGTARIKRGTKFL
jgi:hypothetical protein